MIQSDVMSLNGIVCLLVCHMGTYEMAIHWTCLAISFGWQWFLGTLILGAAALVLPIKCKFEEVLCWHQYKAIECLSMLLSCIYELGKGNEIVEIYADKYKPPKRCQFSMLYAKKWLCLESKDISIMMMKDVKSSWPLINFILVNHLTSWEMLGNVQAVQFVHQYWSNHSHHSYSVSSFRSGWHGQEFLAISMISWPDVLLYLSSAKLYYFIGWFKLSVCLFSTLYLSLLKTHTSSSFSVCFISRGFYNMKCYAL